MASSPTIAIGIPWYREEDWGAVKRVMSDADGLHKHYRDWLQDAHKLERRMRREGHLVERIHLDPVAFPNWCALRGLSPNAEARSQFAAEAVREKRTGRD